jgi:hypothetical protein
MRKPEDKSSGVFDPKWPNLFNVVLNLLILERLL